MFKIGVFGDGGVGKSALTIRYTQDHFIVEYDPTIENSYRKNAVIDGSNCVLDILDTAGEEEYSAMHDQYMRSVQCCVFVYTVNDRRSFDKLGEYYLRTVAARDSAHFACVLAGNKCDLEIHRQVSVEEAEELANRYKAPYFETSAKENTNVIEMFAECVRQINKHPDIAPQTTQRRRKERNCLLM